MRKLVVSNFPFVRLIRMNKYGFIRISTGLSEPASQLLDSIFLFFNPFTETNSLYKAKVSKEEKEGADREE